METKYHYSKQKRKATLNDCSKDRKEVNYWLKGFFSKQPKKATSSAIKALYANSESITTSSIKNEQDYAFLESKSAKKWCFFKSLISQQ